MKTLLACLWVCEDMFGRAEAVSKLRWFMAVREAELLREGKNKDIAFLFLTGMKPLTLASWDWEDLDQTAEELVQEIKEFYNRG